MTLRMLLPLALLLAGAAQAQTTTVYQYGSHWTWRAWCNWTSRPPRSATW